MRIFFSAVILLFCFSALYPQPAGFPAPEQKEDLLYMYEEEKMARDLYTEIAGKWNIRQFDTIRKSEQTHMDALKTIADRYQISLPSTKPGIFKNAEIQSLYDAFLAKGLHSRDNAKRTGIEVEEKDIADLDKAISRASEEASIVYKNLRKGSLNHLEAFKKIK